MGFVEVLQWRGSAPKAFPLRGRWRGEAVTDEVEKGCEFAGNNCKTELVSAHLISLTSFGSFPSRGSLGAPAPVQHIVKSQISPFLVGSSAVYLKNQLTPFPVDGRRKGGQRVLCIHYKSVSPSKARAAGPVMITPSSVTWMNRLPTWRRRTAVAQEPVPQARVRPQPRSQVRSSTV